MAEETNTTDLVPTVGDPDAEIRARYGFDDSTAIALSAEGARSELWLSVSPETNRRVGLEVFERLLANSS